MKKALLFALSVVLIIQSMFFNIAFAETPSAGVEKALYANEIPESVKILAIGNSFSEDATQWLYNILSDLGVKEIVIGNLYIGGCSLKTHSTNAANGAEAYTYYKCNSDTAGAMKAESGKKTLLYGLTNEKWDYICMQQVSSLSGISASYEPHLTNLIEFVNNNKTNPDAKLLWHMTWAYQQDSTHDSFPDYGKSQDIMYKAIVRATNLAISPRSEFSAVIPSGTAVQNMRTSIIGDTVTRDGYHMSNGLGRYLTGVMWAKTILGCDLSNLKTLPEGIGDKELPIIIESVNNAYASPFEVTRSSFFTPEIDALEEIKKPFEIIEATEHGSYNAETKTFTFSNGISVPDGATIVYLPDAAIGTDFGACCYVDGVFYAPRNMVSMIIGETPYEKFSGKVADCYIDTKADDGKMLATLIIENHLKDEPLTGVVRFENEEIALMVGDVEITVGGGETVKTVVELPLKFEGAYTADLSYKYHTQHSEYSCDAIRHFIFVTKPGEIKVDGVLSDGEWDGAVRLVLDENSVSGMKNWTGTDDLSAVAYVAYDSKSIYIAAEVTDDILKVHSHRAWLNGDSIQFDLYLDEENGHFTPGDLTTFTEIGSSHASMVPGVHRYRTNTGKLERGNIENSQVAIIRGEDNTITYEMIVDWKDIFGVDFIPEADNAIGFTFLVNEKDTESNEGWLKFADGSGGNGKRDANKFAQMYFLDTGREDIINDGSFVENGIRYVLFRRTFALKGAEVKWDDTSSMAIATKNGITVSAVAGAAEIKVNDVIKPISGAVKNINCRIYIPATDAEGLLDN